jgi:hypothetical protein
MLVNEKTWEFIRQHADDDVRKLALQGVKDAEVDLQMALQQIAGRQTARRKLPSWAAVDGIIYPPHLNMEQCSSEQTARYKGSLISALSLKGEGSRLFVDLTGGFGVDFYWIARSFTSQPSSFGSQHSSFTPHLVYVEQNETLCTISSHNFELLGLDCSVCCCDTATYLTTMSHADLIYMDPARRNKHGGRTYGIADCSPNVLELLPLLMEKADRVLLKLSPMLDWRKAIEDLKYVSEVHIVSVDNECKELLLLLDKACQDDLRVVCVNFSKDGEQMFTFSPSHPLTPSPSHSLTFSPSHFLYEPNASIMKAGCFEAVEARYPVSQVAPNSHLFLSDVEIGDFPGRKFQILAISSMNKQDIKCKFEEIINQKLTSMKSANITVRNFPMSVDQLRKKLKLKDGGDTYIFATTTASGEHMLLICRKIG